MDNTINQEELLKKMQSEGVPEMSNSRYEEATLEVEEVETTMTGPTSKYDYMKDWEPGQAMIIIHFKVLDGEWKNGRFKLTTGLFTSTGNLRAFAGFTGDDGTYIPASELHDIISAVKEYDKEQWDAKEPFSDKKLIGKKLKIGLRGYEGDERATFFIATERQLKKDEDYKNRQKTEEDEEMPDVFEDKVEETEKKDLPVKKSVSTKKQEVEFDDDDLPF